MIMNDARVSMHAPHMHDIEIGCQPKNTCQELCTAFMVETNEVAAIVSLWRASQELGQGLTTYRD